MALPRLQDDRAAATAFRSTALRLRPNHTRGRLPTFAIQDSLALWDFLSAVQFERIDLVRFWCRASAAANGTTCSLKLPNGSGKWKRGRAPAERRGIGPVT